MKGKSASALVWLSGILILLGWLVMSPSAAFFLFVLSVLLAGVPAAFSAGKIRAVAIVLLTVALFFAVQWYPDFKSERERFHRRQTGFLQTVIEVH
jgi:membrane protein implicated in regulation of membrane protease activity